MVSWIAAVALSPGLGATVERDTYGVARIVAADQAAAYRAMGRVLAEDRLWQMEMSRRTARGQMAAVLGSGYAKSDEETLKRAYTDEEYAAMFALLPANVKTAFQSYAEGVNEGIQARKAAGSLPSGYAQAGFEPEAWTVVDSCAIAVMMARRFGGGGAGELRNYAVAQYLQLRPIKDKTLDVLDDLMWFNDLESPTTVIKGDDPVTIRPNFHLPTRRESEVHLGALPKTSLLELAGAATLGAMSESALVAESVSAPYKTGSYCIVVGPRRSVTGNALLLTAPQMGQTAPSVVHEVSFDVPGMQVSGMNVPGIPGVIIGNSPDMAWGLTTGVSDLEDVFVSDLVDADHYLHNGKAEQLESVTFTLKTKGGPDKTITQLRTVHGPVLLLSKGSKAVYSLRSSYAKRELAGYAAMMDLASVKSTADVNTFARKVPLGFNFFYALRDGHVGWRFLGYVPIRAEGLDPRFPTPDTAANQWKGLIPVASMPRVDDPSSGLIFNWNNKPVWWWPNMDTPAWGSIFRSSVLGDALGSKKLSVFDLQAAAWTIARRETGSNSAFAPLFKSALSAKYGREMPESARQLANYDGWAVDGSVGATIYVEAVRELRKQLFMASLGNLTQDSLFEQAVQPSPMMKALRGETKFSWLGSRKQEEVLIASYEAAVERLTASRGSDLRAWRYSPGSMPDPGSEVRIPYNNRGTYIQVNELGAGGIMSQNVVSPGVAESGSHSFDQAPLARAWTFKSMPGWKP